MLGDVGILALREARLGSPPLTPRVHLRKTQIPSDAEGVAHQSPGSRSAPWEFTPIHPLRSSAPSPKRNARRTHRVTQWYHRVTEGSTRCARAIVMVNSPGVIGPSYLNRSTASTLHCLSLPSCPCLLSLPSIACPCLLAFSCPCLLAFVDKPVRFGAEGRRLIL